MDQPRCRHIGLVAAVTDTMPVYGSSPVSLFRRIQSFQAAEPSAGQIYPVVFMFMYSASAAFYLSRLQVMCSDCLFISTITLTYPGCTSIFIFSSSDHSQAAESPSGQVFRHIASPGVLLRNASAVPDRSPHQTLRIDTDLSSAVTPAFPHSVIVLQLICLLHNGQLPKTPTDQILSLRQVYSSFLQLTVLHRTVTLLCPP